MPLLMYPVCDSVTTLMFGFRHNIYVVISSQYLYWDFITIFMLGFCYNLCWDFVTIFMLGIWHNIHIEILTQYLFWDFVTIFMFSRKKTNKKTIVSSNHLNLLVLDELWVIPDENTSCMTNVFYIVQSN